MLGNVMLGDIINVQVTDQYGQQNKKTKKTNRFNSGYMVKKKNKKKGGETPEEEVNEEPVRVYVMGIEKPVYRWRGPVVAIITNRETGKQIYVTAEYNTEFYKTDIAGVFREARDEEKYKTIYLYEESAGAVVYREFPDEVKYLLIKNHRSSNWGFPKGHVELGETLQETAKREVLEETGTHIKLVGDFKGLSRYKIHGKCEKKVTIFVGNTNDDVSIQPNEIDDYTWLGFERAMHLLNFENDKKIIMSAHWYLEKNNYI